ncbi:hypothetical protein Scep_018712 [Stephania cephalantha]|uniref:Uncharacterized protein n=1 Tax=Stephania cephalantha TaxID=152367 RepID=A0AAP0I9J7_9MAGN
MHDYNGTSTIEPIADELTGAVTITGGQNTVTRDGRQPHVSESDGDTDQTGIQNFDTNRENQRPQDERTHGIVIGERESGVVMNRGDINASRDGWPRSPAEATNIARTGAKETQLIGLSPSFGPGPIRAVMEVTEQADRCNCFLSNLIDFNSPAKEKTGSNENVDLALSLGEDIHTEVRRPTIPIDTTGPEQEEAQVQATPQPARSKESIREAEIQGWRTFLEDYYK